MESDHVTTSLLWMLLQFTLPNNCYYLSPSLLNFTLAESYCSSICNSTLASIHTTNDQNSAELILRDKPQTWWGNQGGAWIGLSSINFVTYSWSDGTPFDFNTDLSGGKGDWSQISNTQLGQHPWLESPYNCVRMSSPGKWISTKCNTTQRVLCNHCNGIINKYALISQQSVTRYDAVTECKNKFRNTTLASIHTTRDNEEAISLWNMDDTHNKWLGMTFTHRDNVSTYKWDDGTPFDYGRNITTSINCDPWSNGPQQFSAGECVAMEGPEPCWKEQACNTAQNYALCNVPSELYPPINSWSSQRAGWISNGTTMTWTQNYNATEAAGLILRNTQWYNGNKSIYIDYMFSIDFLDQIDADSAVVIYNGASGLACEFYFISVRRANISSYGMRIMRGKGTSTGIYKTQVIHERYWDTDAFINGKFYTMSIKITDGHTFEVNVNRLGIINRFNDIDPYELRSDGLSGYIGLWSTKGIITTARNLYVSGTPQTTAVMDLNCSITTPTPYPTNQPITPVSTEIEDGVTTISPSRTETPTESPTPRPIPSTLSPSASPSSSPQTMIAPNFRLMTLCPHCLDFHHDALLCSPSLPVPIQLLHLVL